MDNEVIAGRAESADNAPVLLLAGEKDLIEIDLAGRHATRRRLQIGEDARCWGLARLGNAIWTIRDWKTLIDVEASGRVLREVPLPEPYAGVYGDGDRLVFQPAHFTPPSQALLAGPPGAAVGEPWGALRTRTFPMASTVIAALNLVKCGTTRGSERPCWFPEEPTLALIAHGGNTRRLALPGIAAVAPEVLLTAENPPRPIRDAFLDSRDEIWVLTSGPSGAPDSGGQPGSPLLARYSASGELQALMRLSEPARLILAVHDGRAVLLTGSGYVAEVTP
jgi:hypothetical protein